MTTDTMKAEQKEKKKQKNSVSGGWGFDSHEGGDVLEEGAQKDRETEGEGHRNRIHSRKSCWT